MNSIFGRLNPFILICAIILISVGYGQALLSFHHEWSSNGPYSHGYLACLVALYLLFTSPSLRTSTPQKLDKLLGLIALFMSTALWLLGKLGSILLFEQLGLFSMLVSLMVCFFGLQTVIKNWAPIAVLFLAVPIWGVLQIPLRVVTTDVAVEVLRSLGVPFMRDGFLITLVSGKFLVAEACSGLGFLLTALSFSILFGIIMELNAAKRAAFIFLSIFVALLSNWLRVVIIIYLGYKTEMTHPWVNDHLSFGWILFSLILLFLFFIGYKCLCNESIDSKVAEPSQNKQAKFETSHFNITQTKMYCVAVLSLPLLMSAIMGATASVDKVTEIFQQAYNNSIPFPSRIDWSPVFEGVDQEHMGVLEYDNVTAYRYIGFYSEQKQGREIIFVKNKLFEETRWQTVETQKSKKGFHILTQRRVGNRKAPRLLAYTYLIGGEFTANPFRAKLLEIYSKLKGKPSAQVLAIVLQLDEPVPVGADADADESKRLFENLIFNEMSELKSNLHG